MVRRTSHEGAECPVARPLDALGDSWSLLIIRDAFDGLSRFGQFQKSLGLARNILTNRLNTLVDHGILHTVPAKDGSPYREYLLTGKGRDLFPVLVALRQWSEQHYFKPSETRARLVDRQHHRPVATLEIRSDDGRILTPEDTIIAMLPGDPDQRAESAARAG
ncbi:helix-turn-helix transcriptional regulator [Dactylosporangium sp. NBC_01737]|uniref:winged helix-turn-helix transcriptional regulator n=1 Tax=Dactylosporangium sp. NBC_01737 TaxID=2975959 RepID=UPI002E10A7F7|nr:helix-turn-helix transcriptional regulator [Dactylosporangium sp. NBC_01737]